MILRAGTEAGQTEAIVDCNLADTKCLRWFESNPVHYCKQILMGRYTVKLHRPDCKSGSQCDGWESYPDYPPFFKYEKINH